MTTDDTTIQERPSSASVKGSASLPKFDPTKYREELNGLNLTEEQETELLSIIWTIMYSFVQIGFDVKNCGQIFESFTQAAQSESDGVDLSRSSKQEKRAPEGRSHE